MALQLSAQKRVSIAARFEVWGSIVQVQRWFKSTLGRNEKLSKNTIKLCHSKLFDTGSVSNTKRPQELSKKRNAENVTIFKNKDRFFY